VCDFCICFGENETEGDNKHCLYDRAF
jgi:hypothetical protein